MQIFGLVAFIEQKENDIKRYRFPYCSIKATRPKICKKSVCYYCITTSLWRTPVNYLLIILSKLNDCRCWGVKYSLQVPPMVMVEELAGLCCTFEYLNALSIELTFWNYVWGLLLWSLLMTESFLLPVTWMQACKSSNRFKASVMILADFGPEFISSLRIWTTTVQNFIPICQQI